MDRAGCVSAQVLLSYPLSVNLITMSSYLTIHCTIYLATRAPAVVPDIYFNILRNPGDIITHMVGQPGTALFYVNLTKNYTLLRFAP